MSAPNLYRYGHSVTFDGSSFIVVGGYGTLKTEICFLEGTNMSCIEQGEPIKDYKYYPSLFLIADDYGDNC